MQVDIKLIQGVVVLSLGVILAGCSSGASSSQVSMTQAVTNEASVPVDDVMGIHACDDLPIVTVKEMYDDGRLSLEQEVVIVDGEQISHGLMTHYWQSGKKKLQIEYVCGKKHGLRASWHQDGKPWSVGEHFYGKDHGEWIVWYADGQKQQQFTIEKGTWNGPYSSWHVNSQMKMNVDYVMGQRQGPLRLWDDHGNLSREIHYANDKVQPSPR